MVKQYIAVTHVTVLKVYIDDILIAIGQQSGSDIINSVLSGSAVKNESVIQCYVLKQLNQNTFD